MSRLKRVEISVEANRRSLEQLARLGGELRSSRNRRHLTQADVAGAAGLGRSTLSAVERGRGGAHSLIVWQRLALAVGRPLRVELERDRDGDTTDAAHLAIQELVLRSARPAGWAGTFELPVRAGYGRHSVDVGLRNDRLRVLAWIECWNTLDDLGAAVRSSTWKLRRAEEAAVAIGGDRTYRVTGCWVVRSTRHNRALVARYPELFGTQFPGSSLAWLRALTLGTSPPAQLGLIWCDAATHRLLAWRQRR